MQADYKQNVQVFMPTATQTAAAAYLANNPTTVTAWEVTGQSFVAAGLGTMYAIGAGHGPFIELKYMELFTQVSPGINLQLGYAVGF